MKTMKTALRSTGLALAIASTALGQHVGIATDNPVERLHVQNGNLILWGAVGTSSPKIIFNALGQLLNNQLSHDVGLTFERSGTWVGAIRHTQPGTPNAATPPVLRFSASAANADDMVIDNQGRMGIGLRNPASRLDVNGNMSASGNLFLASNTAIVQLRAADNTNKGYMQLSGDNLRIGTNAGNNLGKFVIRMNGTDRVFVDEDGNMSIGTSVVSLGHRLNVNGRIICEELKVRLFAQWPDYVFEENYPLMPFWELREHIASKRHLPNIPAAAQMEAEGLPVGEMQRRLVEKIEELTLYILQLEARVNHLEKNEK